MFANQKESFSHTHDNDLKFAKLGKDLVFYMPTTNGVDAKMVGSTIEN